jgi:hypothetical protein
VTVIVTCTTLSYCNYLVKLVNIGLLMVCRCRDVLPLIQQTHCVLALSCDNPVRISTQCKSYRYFFASCESTRSEDIHHDLCTVRKEMKMCQLGMYALQEEIYNSKHASERSRGLRGCLRNMHLS